MLEQLIVITPTFHVWSAKSKLQEVDLEAVELSPESKKIIDLGNKAISNPHNLKVFLALKQRTLSFLCNNSIKFLNGFAIPTASLGKIALFLQDIQLQFNEAKRQFLKNYESNLQLWIEEHEEFREALERSAVSASYVEKRISFSFRAFKVAEASELSNAMINQALQEDIEKLGLRLFYEISQKGKAISKKTFDSRDRVTRKALSPIKVLRNKLDSLSFLDPRAEVLVKHIDDVLRSLPSKGSLSGNALNSLKQLVALLSDEEQMWLVSESKLKGLEVVK